MIELNRVSAWIREQMRDFGIPCQFQNYVVNQQSYRNVVCKLNIGAAQKTIFGAHYDVYGQQQGANDNASGVAGVMETARILAQEKNKLSQNVEFVFIPWQSHHFLKPSRWAVLYMPNLCRLKKKIPCGVCAGYDWLLRQKLGAKLPNRFKVDLPKSWQFYCGIEQYAVT